MPNGRGLEAERLRGVRGGSRHLRRRPRCGASAALSPVSVICAPGRPSARVVRPPRPPAEAVFDRLMVERVVIAAAVMGLASFVVFWLWLDSSTGAAGGVGSGATVLDAYAGTGALGI